MSFEGDASLTGVAGAGGEVAGERAGAQGQAPAERVVARLRPRAHRLFVPALVVIAVCGAVGFLYGRFAEDWQNLLLVAGGLVAVIVVGVLPLLSWLSWRYTITTRRVILRHGLVVRVRQELLHSRGYDVTVRRGALQTMLRTGNVLINAGLENPVVLRNVPTPNLVQATLNDLMEANQNQISVNRQQWAADSDRTVAWGTR